jgi:hypothetical protein
MNCIATRLILWLVTLVAFPIPRDLVGQSFQVEVLQHLTRSLPPEEPLQLDLSERVLSHLEVAEKKEIDPWFRDDYRIAWITVKWSHEGVPSWCCYSKSPHIAATYQVLHCHPDEVWPRIVAQRKAKLGNAYEKVWGVALPPKKPVRSARPEDVRSARLAA